MLSPATCTIFSSGCLGFFRKQRRTKGKDSVPRCDAIAVFRCSNRSSRPRRGLLPPASGTLPACPSAPRRNPGQTSRRKLPLGWHFRCADCGAPRGLQADLNFPGATDLPGVRNKIARFGAQRVVALSFFSVHDDGDVFEEVPAAFLEFRRARRPHGINRPLPLDFGIRKLVRTLLDGRQARPAAPSSPPGAPAKRFAAYTPATTAASKPAAASDHRAYLCASLFRICSRASKT